MLCVHMLIGMSLLTGYHGGEHEHGAPRSGLPLAVQYVVPDTRRPPAMASLLPFVPPSVLVQVLNESQKPGHLTVDDENTRPGGHGHLTGT
jgi:hypothetical protein